MIESYLSIRYFFFFFAVTKAEAVIDAQSAASTVVSATQISQPINVIMSGLLNLLVALKVKALDSYITNTTNSSLKIPITQLYLNDGANSYQMQNNIDVTILNTLISITPYTKPYNIVVNNVSAIPAGTYNTRLQFALNANLSTETFIFTLTFTIPVE